MSACCLTYRIKKYQIFSGTSAGKTIHIDVNDMKVSTAEKYLKLLESCVVYIMMNDFWCSGASLLPHKDGNILLASRPRWLV